MRPKQEGLVVNSGCPGLRKEARHPPGIEMQHLGQQNCRERGTHQNAGNFSAIRIQLSSNAKWGEV